jgi:hypothetical protein
MYDNFIATDRWTGEHIHCQWIANIVAISTRHADAVDIKFLANGRPVWISLPCLAWAEYRRLHNRVITDRLAVQIAGHYLKQAIESGYDNGREMYTLTVDETFAHLDAVMGEAKHTDNLPIVPRISGTGNTDTADPQRANTSMVPHGNKY